MLRIPIPAPHGQRGYALVLVMVALVTLTILGVTGIQSAQLDMKITQNMRHHKQLQYGGMAGQDHGRVISNTWNDSNNLAREKYEAAWNGTAGCTIGWLGLGSGAEEAPVPMMANSVQLATYTVDLCAGVCGPPPPGYSLDQDDGLHTASLDMVASGAMTGSNSSAQMGGLLVGVWDGGCF
jgi:hypothetical protein